MELKKLKNKTYMVEGFSTSLLYETAPGRCVLLDTPLMAEWPDFRALLTESGFTPEALLLSHAHHDHSGCAKFLRESFGTKIYASAGEAAALCSPTAYCSYTGFISPGLLMNSFLKDCVLGADGAIPPGERVFSAAGADFRIFPAPGHTPDHLAMMTPDGVLFCGDALVSPDEVARQKMTYSLGVADHMASARRLAELDPALVVVSHKGALPGAELPKLCQINIDHLEACAMSLLEVIQGRPMGMDEIREAYCLGLNMTRVDLDHPQKALMVRRVAVSYVEYLIDTGRVRPHIQGGVFRFSRATETEAGR